MSFFNPFKRSTPGSSSNEQAFPGQGRTFDEEDREEEKGIKLVVKYERDRFNIPIPKPSVTPLSTLIETLSQHTSIPASQLKLIHNGAVLKNTTLPIASFGLKDGSIIVLVGSNAIPPAASSSGTAAARKKEKDVVPDNEEGLVRYIEGKTGFMEGLKSDLETYLRESEEYVNGSSGTNSVHDRPSKPTSSTIPTTTPSSRSRSQTPVPTGFAHLEKSHARISEMLLQGLLALDGITIPSEWTKARGVRKNGVRTVQGELDKVDEAWLRVKQKKRSEAK